MRILGYIHIQVCVALGVGDGTTGCDVKIACHLFNFEGAMGALSGRGMMISNTPSKKVRSPRTLAAL